MNKINKLVMGIFCATVIGFSAYAGTTNSVNITTNAVAPEAWVLTLGGAGSTTTSGTSQTDFGVNVGFGRTGHLLLPIEVGIRQGVAYADSSDGAVILDSKAYTDVTVFKYKRFETFLGGNIGVTYGDTPLAWTAAPEAGVRLWITKDVAMISRVEYPFDLNNGRAEDNLNYMLGFQVKF